MLSHASKFGIYFNSNEGKVVRITSPYWFPEAFVAIATEGDEGIRDSADHVIYIPRTSPDLTPILSAIPMQLISYYMAVRRGCDVDQPRNLAKSVTVE